MTTALSRPLEDVLHARYEKSARALVAVARALERNRPLGGEEAEFLALAHSAEDVVPDVFTQVWRDPFAYWWVRHAYQLTSSAIQNAPVAPFTQTYVDLLGANDVKEALRLHIDQFKVLSLGLAIAGGADVAFDKPLRARLPLAVPGTRLVVQGRGEIDVGGAKDGRLVAPDGSAITTEECPLATDGERDWRLQPAAFSLPGLGYDMPAESFDLAWQRECQPYAIEALTLITRYMPEMRAPFDAVSRLIGFKQYEIGDFTNVTHSELPGSFVSSLTRDAYDLADSMVHEFHHNLLYALEEDAPFFAPETDRRERFYSPWRSDQRDLHGILHAIYVFIATSRFWLAVQRAGDAPEHVAPYLADRLVRYPLQLEIGLSVLGRATRWTEHGAALDADLQREVAEIRAAVQASGAPADALSCFCEEDGLFHPQLVEGVQITSRESVLAHLRNNDTSGSGHVAAQELGIDLG